MQTVEGAGFRFVLSPDLTQTRGPHDPVHSEAAQSRLPRSCLFQNSGHGHARPAPPEDRPSGLLALGCCWVFKTVSSFLPVSVGRRF